MPTRQSKAITPANQRLAELVREAFNARPEMNRQALADRSGVPDGTLAGIFAGTKPVYAEQLMDLADALDVDPRLWLQEMRRARDEAEER